MKLVLKYERSTKHSHLFKAEDGSNLYIKKEHLNGEKLNEDSILTVVSNENS